jgi:RNA polymerase sigma factor (sigma-70 family)
VVALNAARRSFRDSRREAELPLDLPPDASESDLVVGAVAVRELLGSLPPRQRAAVVLRYLADLTIAETAAAMGCAEGTVKSAVHAALRQLRAGLSEESRHE